MTVTPELVEKYARGVGVGSGLELPADETGRPVAPATVLAWELFNFPRELIDGIYERWPGLLFGGAEWEFVEPVHVGDTVELRMRVADRYHKAGREWQVLELTATGADGRTRYRVRALETWPTPQAQGATAR